MIRSRVAAGLMLAVAFAAAGVSLESQSARPFRIEVSFPASLESKPLDGRVILVDLAARDAGAANRADDAASTRSRCSAST